MTERQEQNSFGMGFVDSDKLVEVLEGPGILCWGCGRTFRMTKIEIHRLVCGYSAMHLGIIMAPSIRCFKHSFLGLVGWKTRCELDPNDVIRPLAVSESMSFREKYSAMLGGRSTKLVIIT